MERHLCIHHRNNLDVPVLRVRAPDHHVLQRNPQVPAKKIEPAVDACEKSIVRAVRNPQVSEDSGRYRRHNLVTTMPHACSLGEDVGHIHGLLHESVEGCSCRQDPVGIVVVQDRQRDRLRKIPLGREMVSQLRMSEPGQFLLNHIERHDPVGRLLQKAREHGREIVVYGYLPDVVDQPGNESQLRPPVPHVGAQFLGNEPTRQRVQPELVPAEPIILV